MSEVGSWDIRRTVAAGLRRIGLLGTAFRLYEAALALEWPLPRRARARLGPDGLPVPPARLRARIGPRAMDREFFLRSGEEHARLIREAVRQDDATVDRFRAILDFGCGCGRVLRHWRDLDGVEVQGTDISAMQIRWCERNLPFARVGVNELEPPLPHGDGVFDLVYSFSVFTHLPEDLQFGWLAELRRLLRPGGYLLFSTHGRHYLDRLNDAERSAFERGELIVLWPEGAGTGLCSVYHPKRYVEGVLARDWQQLSFLPAAASGQDVYLFRKPAAAAGAGGAPSA